MIIFSYDKSFEGLLCVLFDAFKQKKVPDTLIAQGELTPLIYTELHHIETVVSKYERVQRALQKRLTEIALQQVICVWLSEQQDSDILIFRYLYKLFKVGRQVETNFADPDVLMLRKIALKVEKERQHIMQFVRFNAIKQTNGSVEEKIYFSVIAPIYNALPLAIGFFQDRFADQKWAIYDKNRKYGYFYDLHTVEKISIKEGQTDLLVNNQINQNYFSSDEHFFQTMWTRYCKALTIKERTNLKQQRQHMPKRFWQDLPEMRER